MKEESKHFALFTNSWLGVSETFIFRQAYSLKNYGNVVILTQNRKFSKILEETGFNPKVYLAPLSKTDLWIGIIKRKLFIGRNLYGASYRQIRYWREVLQKSKPDILHAHYGNGGLAILSVTKKLSIPQITTFHGNDASVLIRKKAYVKSLQELFKYSYIITVSNFIRERLISLGGNPDKIFCHYIGTDLNKFSFVKRTKSYFNKVKLNEKIVFLQVSNFVEKKGHEYTVHAFANYLKYNSNAELVFGGDGKLRPIISELVNALGIGDKVTFLGAIGPLEVNDLMKTCDVFLHHSITGLNGSEEGIPTVLMEAMAVGIPVVSTFHAGIPELVLHKECGVLVEERNVENYSQALIELEKLDTEAMALHAYQRVREYFDINKQNESLFKIYKKVIKEFDN